MLKIHQLTSKTVVVPNTNIDTDIIIPARFLKVTDKKGLGEKAFFEWRYKDGVVDQDCILNQDAAKGAQIMVAGDNFGCGSSREHAPWALLDYGFRAVISTSIADIFRGNSLKNGFLPIEVDKDFHAKLMAQGGTEVTIDLEKQQVTAADGSSVGFEVEPFARYCLLNGMDQLDYLLSHMDAIKAFEEARI